MKYIFIISYIIFANIFCINLYSQTNDSLTNLLKVGFYDDMINIITPEYVEDIKNSTFEDYKQFGIYLIDADGVTEVSISKSINKYFKKLKNIDTCTKYFDTCLCKVKWMNSEFKKVINKSFHYYLNNKVYDVRNDLDSLKRMIIELDSIHNYNSTADTIDGRYIPKNLDDAFQQLDSLLEPDYKKRFIGVDENSAVSKKHFGLGMSLRNSWRLWGSSRLQRHIYSKYGIKHPDRQSSFILTLYYRKLKGIDLNIEQLKSKLQEQEANQEEEEKKSEENE